MSVHFPGVHSVSVPSSWNRASLLRSRRFEQQGVFRTFLTASPTLSRSFFFSVSRSCSKRLRKKPKAKAPFGHSPSRFHVCRSFFSGTPEKNAFLSITLTHAVLLFSVRWLRSKCLGRLRIFSIYLLGFFFFMEIYFRSFSYVCTGQVCSKTKTRACWTPGNCRALDLLLVSADVSCQTS